MLVHACVSDRGKHRVQPKARASGNAQIILKSHEFTNFYIREFVAFRYHDVLC
jgi:hypothetical protein